MKLTYEQCRDLNEFLAKANEKIQNYRQYDIPRNRCIFCMNLISHETLTNANYCSLGGFRIRMMHVCDHFNMIGTERV